MIALRLAAACAALMLTAAPAAAAQQPFPPQPAIGTPRPFTLPAAETFRLANGLQVTLVPYGIAPKATVSLRIDAGNLNEGEDVWLADLAGEMLREGAGGRSAEAIAEAAASMGGELVVGVGQLETQIGLGILSEHAAEAVRLVADVALRPDLPESELERVRQNLARNAAVARSQPQPVADAVFARAYYGAHPYGRLLPSDAQLAGYTIDQVRRFHRENFGARRARLYVAGRFDAAAVRQAIEQAFGSWQPGPERLALPPAPRQGPQLLLVDRPDAPQSTIRVGFPAPAAGATGDIDMRVMNALLGGAFTSRITQNIREDKGYTYSPGSGVQYHAGEALWTFQADVTTSDTGAALREVIGEVRRLQNEAPPADETGGMGRWLAGTFVLQNASASGLINSLAQRDLHGLPPEWLEGFVPAVLDIDSDEVRRIAAERLPLDRMTIVIVGDLDSVRPQLETVPELRAVDAAVADPV
ncbi:M16 family metallopeptidase [Sphingosinicella terrae]|uniref:M16 family metallopeptidase n=1 Tax=Sphingosinicella terrae TaxID=2172047 RepID=UPI000E0CC726|nr:pitrilysin family protein [Sphingosinicella terrae]